MGVSSESRYVSFFDKVGGWKGSIRFLKTLGSEPVMENSNYSIQLWVLWCFESKRGMFNRPVYNSEVK